MELALYHPEHGYYSQSHIGKSGDFFTSVSVGSLFGEFLAYWLVQELKSIPGTIDLVEAGAHDGTLARDVLNWLRKNEPEFAARAYYTVVEPNCALRARQRETLRAVSTVRWVDGLDELATQTGGRVRGAIFSNELLDAFPVRVFRWIRDAKQWNEFGVAEAKGQFIWRAMGPNLVGDALHDLEPLQPYLPDQFTVEFSPIAEAWWTQAARLLGSGLLCAFDYGDEATGLWTPDRYNGTLRSFQGHRFIDNVLDSPGCQDITASVNFTRIRLAGERAGLVSRPLVAQERFLSRIAASFFRASPADAQIRQFQTLAHPSQLGRAFKVLVQSRTNS